MMKLYLLAFIQVAAATAIVKTAEPAGHEWQAPKPGDQRSPCPMLNSLANHGYLPRSGLDIDLSTLKQAMSSSINFKATTFLEIAFSTALITSTTADPSSTFNLHDIAAHNVIEHDGSLSRGDAFFGDALRFDEAVWRVTRAHLERSGGETVPLTMAARAREERLRRARAANPAFNLTAFGALASVTETALYSIVLGDSMEGNPKTHFVRVFFEQERIPFKEGYTRREDGITQEQLDAMVAKVAAL